MATKIDYRKLAMTAIELAGNEPPYNAEHKDMCAALEQEFAARILNGMEVPARIRPLVVGFMRGFFGAAKAIPALTPVKTLQVIEHEVRTMMIGALAASILYEEEVTFNGQTKPESHDVEEA